MDNSNNPNWPNSPIPPSPSNGTTPPPINPVNQPAQPGPQPENPATFPQNPSSDWTPPAQPSPLPDPSSSFFPSQQPAAQSEPTPTLNNPSAAVDFSSPLQSQPPISPLDNPWNAPAQPPPFDGSTQNSTPTWVPTPTPSPTPAEPVNPVVEPSPVATEPAPTDLSHLISNNTQSEPASPIAPAEILVVPPSVSTPEVPTMPLEDHKGIPKWLIGVGIGLLIIVLGASAYFILGIGQPGKETTSLPAQITKTEVKAPPPIPAPIPEPPAAATGSADFGQLEGSGNKPSATSAADILRQRLQNR